MSQRTSNQPCHEISTNPKIEVSTILPFLYLGCQEDALSKKIIQEHHITHVINVSQTGERASFLDENDDEHFLRIPINDCHNAKLLPYFDTAYAFIEKVRLGNGRVLIHCLAGISRSPALAIAYVMQYLHLSADDAYKYVKQRRSQISPNFNFLGQLSEYERILALASKSVSHNTRPIVKCCTVETPLNDRRRFIQVEGRSNTIDSLQPRNNSLPRPTCFNFDLNNASRPNSRLSALSPMTNLLIETSSETNLVTQTLQRPKTISLKHSELRNASTPLALFNSSCDELRTNERMEPLSNSLQTSSFMEQASLINTYFQDSPVTSKSLQSWESTPSPELPSKKTETIANVLSSSHELSVS